MPEFRWGKQLLNVIVWFEEGYSLLTLCLFLEIFLLIFGNIISKTKIRKFLTFSFISVFCVRPLVERFTFCSSELLFFMVVDERVIWLRLTERIVSFLIASISWNFHIEEEVISRGYAVHFVLISFVPHWKFIYISEMRYYVHYLHFSDYCHHLCCHIYHSVSAVVRSSLLQVVGMSNLNPLFRLPG